MSRSGPRLGQILALAAIASLLGFATASATTTTVVPAGTSGGAFQVTGAFTFGDQGYTPADIAVTPGATVTWTGPFGIHPLLFDDGSAGATSGPSFTTSMQTPGHVLFHSPDAGGGVLRGSIYVAGPVPQFRATQVAAPDPRVRLDASSTDFVGFTHNLEAQYEFDADGDGVFDTKSANPIVSFRYPGEGSYTARLRVTDDGGFSAETTGTVLVTRDGIPADPDHAAPQLAPANLVPVGRRALRRGATVVIGTPSESVTASVSVVRGSTVIARGTASGLGQQALTVKLLATTAGRRLILRSRLTRVTLQIRVTDQAGNATDVQRSLRLRGP